MVCKLQGCSKKSSRHYSHLIPSVTFSKASLFATVPAPQKQKGSLWSGNAAQRREVEVGTPREDGPASILTPSPEVLASLSWAPAGEVSPPHSGEEAPCKTTPSQLFPGAFWKQLVPSCFPPPGEVLLPRRLLLSLGFQLV